MKTKRDNTYLIEKSIIKNGDSHFLGTIRAAVAEISRREDSANGFIESSICEKDTIYLE